MNVVPREMVLAVSGLSVELVSGVSVVHDVSFELRAGETLGLVGESGSGKTTTALALLGYAREGMRIVNGMVQVRGQRVALDDEKAARELRGSVVSHVPQDPASNLNPSLRVGSAIADVVGEHRPRKDRQNAVLGALGRVHLPTTQGFARRFPHELSGGQQQRVLIASALVCEPPLVVLDEPTTGLDVVTQARVLAEIQRLSREEGVAMVYVSHDLAVIAQVADQIAVMYAGCVVEHGPSETILSSPRHPYTRGLVSSIPDHSARRRLPVIPGVAVGLTDRPAGCPFAPRCGQKVPRCLAEFPALEQLSGRAVRCFEASRTPPLEIAQPIQARPAITSYEPVLAVEHLRAIHKGREGTVVAAHDISFVIARGECVALAGESGSGKTTVARAIAGLHPPAAGRILLDGVVLAGRAQQRPREVRRRCQIIFQNPYASLNPRKRILDEVARPARVLRGLTGQAADTEATQLLERVRLPARLGRKYPSELSGGERQRVAIARALIAKPDLLVCDEITSALDVSVQAAVIELLTDLRLDLSLSLLFITHDLGVVASIADRVLILDQGVICEEGVVERVFTEPQSPYTTALLAAVPTLRGRPERPDIQAAPSLTER